MVKADRKNLIRLLDYWIEHNTEHKAEFEEWAEKAKDYAGVSVPTSLKEAARHLEMANKYLNKALTALKE